MDQPLGEPVDGDSYSISFGEEDKNAIKALLEIIGPRVNGFHVRVQAEKTKARTEDPQKERDEEDIDLAFELAENVVRMRMTVENLLQYVGTEIPLQLVLDMKKVGAATCLDELETMFGPTEADIEELVNSGGDLADLLEKFPQISLKDEKTTAS